MKNILGLAVLILFNFSCTKENKEFQENLVVSELTTSPESCFNLEVGKCLAYIFYTAENYFVDDNYDFQYTGDTLFVFVESEEGGKFLVKEWISENSAMFTSSEEYYWNNKDSTFSNYWFVRNDSLVMETTQEYINSHLMFWPYTLPLSTFDENETEIIGWKTTLGYQEGRAELYTENYSLLGNSYDYLNVLIENTSMQLDGPGATFAYSKEHGLIKSNTYSWWTSTGYGWDKK